MTSLLRITGALLLAASAARAQTTDLVFIHHSCGANWLGDGLDAALLAKPYIDERNDITYGTDMEPDTGRPDSLGATPGDATDMNHWILWFNDYLRHVIEFVGVSGSNQVIMFKSCYPNSDVYDEGSEPGDPFVGDRTIVNHKAVFRHPDGPGGCYTNDGYVYQPLEDVFAAHPDVLFIPVTAPPMRTNETSRGNAYRARVFNDWLKDDWMTNYNARHPGLNNVAVFDWFNILAYPTNTATWSNRLRAAYQTGDSHPNATANRTSTWFFATGRSNFIDRAWYNFNFKAAQAQPGAAGQLLISWPSFTNNAYAVRKSTNLLEGFKDVHTNVNATPPQNTVTVGVDHASFTIYRVETRP